MLKMPIEILLGACAKSLEVSVCLFVLCIHLSI